MSNEHPKAFDDDGIGKEIGEFDFKPEQYGDVEDILSDEGAVPDSDSPETSGQSAAGMAAEANREAEKVAVAFLKKVLRLRSVQIDREQFLRSELKKRWVSDADIERAIATDVITAGINPEILDDIAKSAITFETRKSSALSAAAGLPGALGMVATVPADVTQYYVHAFRIMQKLAYVYGWTAFFDQAEEVSDEVLAQFATFFGVMLGVAGAANGVRTFIAQMAAPAIQKNVAKKALTKTAWYPVMKKTLRLVGVKITRDSVGRAAGKAVPVVGGVISGSMTYVALKSQSKRLQATLREIPAPNGVATTSYFGVDLTEPRGAVEKAEQAKASRITSTVSAAAGSLKNRPPPSV